MFRDVQRERGGVIAGERVRGMTGPAGRLPGGAWYSPCRRGAHSAEITSLTAARAADWSTIFLPVTQVAMSAAMARLLTARGLPRAASWTWLTASNEPPHLPHSARQIVRDVVVPRLRRRSTNDSRPLMTTIGETAHIDESRRDCPGRHHVQ